VTIGTGALWGFLGAVICSCSAWLRVFEARQGRPLSKPLGEGLGAWFDPDRRMEWFIGQAVRCFIGAAVAAIAAASRETLPYEAVAVGIAAAFLGPRLPYHVAEAVLRWARDDARPSGGQT
jgi:hypothetical protein